MAAGKLIAYIRVSSVDQNPERQLEGIKFDKKFIDHVSGKSIKRPQLEKLLEYVRDGDEIIVHSMDRLARNLDDLRKLVRELNARDVSLRFVKENLVFNGEDSPMSNLLLSVMGAAATSGSRCIQTSSGSFLNEMTSSFHSGKYGLF